MILRWIVKILAALNANTRPGEIAAAFALGILLALVPSGNLLWPVLFLITLLLKVHFSVELVALGIGKLFAPVLDGLLDRIGYAILTFPAFGSAFTSFYSVPFVPFTRFNDTVVMGGLAAGLVLFIPIVLLVRVLVTLYRTKIRDRIAETKFMKGLMKVPLVAKIAGAYAKARGVYGLV